MLFHNKANSSFQQSECSSIVKDTLKVCFMCQAREFGRCTSFGTLPKTNLIFIVIFMMNFKFLEMPIKLTEHTLIGYLSKKVGNGNNVI